MKKRDITCKLVKDSTSINFNTSKGILNSVRMCFKKAVPRIDREKIERKLKRCEMNAIWSGSQKCVNIK